jgi:glycosyltransferase involved in cell wall biosynthesis
MSSETVLHETMTAAEAAGTTAPATKKGRERRIVVVYVIDNMQLGGTELNAVRTAERLDREWFELRVVCLGEDGPLTERYRAMGVPVVNMPIRSFYGWSMLRRGLQFVRYVHQARADIVHAHDVYSNIFAAVWARVAGVRVLITSRRWWHSLPNWKLRRGSRFAFARANAVLANSPQVARTVMEDGVPENRVWTITNFADDSAFGIASDAERRALRLQWGAPNDATVIGCVARMDPVKDHAGLLDAFARVHAKKRNVFLVLVGDGEMRPELESQVNAMDLANVVHFTGELRDGRNYHRGFDISALASRSEGFPNTLVEAMAAGRPVVATAVGGSIDAVAHEKTGLLVPPADSTALAEALLRLVEDEAAREKLGRQALQRALDQYQAQRVVGSLADMYRELLAVRST